MPLSDRIRAMWIRLPLAGRKFAIDAAEGALTGVLVLNVALPHTTAEATSQLVLVGSSIAGPVIAAARRYLLPAAAAWLVATFPRPE